MFIHVPSLCRFGADDVHGIVADVVIIPIHLAENASGCFLSGVPPKNS